MPTLPALEVPIVAAPMAGGPSTPELVAAVAAAGGLGFLAGGYLSGDALAAQLRDLRERSDRPFGVNLFLPPPDGGDPDPTGARSAAVAAYARELASEAAAFDVALGDPVRDDDAVDDKIAALAADPPAVISLTFALPDRRRLDALRATGAALVATVTSVDEARAAAGAGMDALCVQGAEAGGHRGVHVDRGGDPEEGAVGLLDLLDGVRAAVDLPVIAAGGLASADSVRSVLRAGAVAAQLGTAFLRCPEAGTSATHRAALAQRVPPPSDAAALVDEDTDRGPGTGTVVTRAFTGRPARALGNRFVRDHGATAPAAYPELHHLTRPLRAAASAAGDADALHLWAGTAWRAATEEPAAAVVRRCAPPGGS